MSAGLSIPFSGKFDMSRTSDPEDETGQSRRKRPVEHWPGVGDRITRLLGMTAGPDGSRRMTQGELAAQLGLSRSSISTAVSEDRLTRRTAQRIAKVWGLPVEQLLEGPIPDTITFREDGNGDVSWSFTGHEPFVPCSAFFVPSQIKGRRVRERVLSRWGQAPPVGPIPGYLSEDTEPIARGADDSPLADFLTNMDRLVRTLSTVGDLPAASKIAILNGFEEAARVAGRQLPREYWELRQRVVHEDASKRSEGGVGSSDAER